MSTKPSVSPSVNPSLSQTPIQWYGGKWEIADWLASLLPRGNTLVLPYGGAGSPIWHVEPYPVEVYNDIDRGLVNFFRVCRQYPESLAAALEMTPFAREEYVDGTSDPDAEDFTPPAGAGAVHAEAALEIERARRFAFVARASVSGRWGRGWSRVIDHSRRGMSSSVSRWLHLPQTVIEIAARMKTVQIENLPAINLICEYDRPGTVFYLDPPYPSETRNGADVYRHEMTEADHVALLNRINECVGRVAISGYDCELYNSRLGSWRRADKEVSCRSNVSASGKLSNRPKRVETVWMNY